MAIAKYQVNLPEDFSALLGQNSQAVEAIKEFTILGLYLEGRISASKAAESLNLNLRSFVTLLARKGINYFRPDQQSWMDELKSLQTLEDKHG